jgi:hypothetical protein
LTTCDRAMYPHSENARVTTLAGAPGIASFKDAVGSRARFNEPNAVLHIKLARHSLCLVADGSNNRVRAIDLESETMRVSTIAGSSASGYSDGNGLHGGAATFHYPSALATLQDTSSPSSPFVVVWVADMYNSVVRRLEVREEEAVVMEGESIATGATGATGATVGSELKVTCGVTTLRLVHALSRAPVSLCVCVCVCVCVCLCVCIRMYVYMYIGICV